jgi:heat shock protein HslJ
MNMSRRVLLGLFVGGLAITAVACGDDPAPASENTAVTTSLQGKTYAAIGAQGIDLPANSNLTFHFAATRLFITGGCADMSGTWRIETNRLMVPRLAVESTTCDDAGLNLLDQQVMQIVSSQPVIGLSGDQMKLTRDAATLNFRETTPVKDVPLEGTLWTVTGTLEGDGTAALDTEPGTLTFAAGTVEVFTGCNTGSGGYTATDTTIRFDAIAMTATACADPAMQMEAAVTRTLTGTVTWDIEGTKLTLAQPDGTGLTLTSAP